MKETVGAIIGALVLIGAAVIMPPAPKPVFNPRLSQIKTDKFEQLGTQVPEAGAVNAVHVIRVEGVDGDMMKAILQHGVW